MTIQNFETFAKHNNTAMPISSRRYLSAYEHVIKYLEFAKKGADSYGLRGINTKYLITCPASAGWNFFKDIVFQKQP